MATPVFVDLPADTWTPIAIDIVQGQVHLVDTSPNVIRATYIQPTGDPAPADNAALGVPVFEESLTEAINFTASADVYLRPEGKASRVRVDV